MYYILDYEIPENEEGGYLDFQDIEIDGIESWYVGKRFNIEVPNPIEIDIIPIGDYDGPPSEMYQGHMVLMSNKLVETLKELGIYNIDCYPAVLKNVKTGEKYSYQAVNIIGVIAAVDLQKSNWESYDGDPLFDVNFNGIVINHQASKNKLLFRLAESIGTIVVHETIRDNLISRGFNTLYFIKPSDLVT